MATVTPALGDDGSVIDVNRIRHYTDFLDGEVTRTATAAGARGDYARGRLCVRDAHTVRRPSAPLCPQQYGRGPYREKVQDMIRRKETRLIVSLDDLHQFDDALGERDPAYKPVTRQYGPPRALPPAPRARARPGSVLR